MPSSVPLRPLGKNGPLVPSLGLGLMPLSSPIYGAFPSEEEQHKYLDHAFELGSTFWDTSDFYGNSEETIGSWFKKTGKRNEIFLATKGAFIKGSPTWEIDSSAAFLKKACEDSLRNLGVDHIDLYYVHNVKFETPIEDTMRGLKELQDEGKIKYIGLSMVSSTTLRRAYKIAPVAAVQIEYSVFSREVEGPAGTNLLTACRELGVAVVVATPLGRGLLTSNFASGGVVETDQRAQLLPRFADANQKHNIGIVSQFAALAAKKGCSMPQLALAWLLKQGNDIFPTPGTKRIKYMDENWKALDFALSDAEEAEIRALAESVELAGGPAPDVMKSRLFGETREQ